MTSHSKPYRLVDGQRVYDFRATCKFLQAEGKLRYGHRFALRKEDREILYQLMVYAIGDDENCERLNLDPQKGLMLIGPVGCGKTTLMTLLRMLVHPEYRYNLISAREVAFRFSKDGFKVIRELGSDSFFRFNKKRVPRAICFDDLGTEKELSYYGNKTNVMGEILLSRYDAFISHGMLTHVTTNLNAKELEGMYGKRVRSRMRSMFNVITFPKNATDKRL
jgi:energy-coupling factor transporter ATP-binding protein EcfA2